MIGWLFSGLVETIMSALPWVLTGAAIVTVVATTLLGNALTRPAGYALSAIMALAAAYYFGADSVREDARVASLRAQLEQQSTDLAIAQRSVEYWTKQHLRQEAEADELNRKVTEYEKELGNTSGVCTLDERDVERLRNIGR